MTYIICVHLPLYPKGHYKEKSMHKISYQGGKLGIKGTTLTTIVDKKCIFVDTKETSSSYYI